ncbi:squamosa promoter binding protein-like 15 [Striga asiatica]|uniref:Squamosa promoter binding protein-like 15 n=1 Tax=Striga asiatica TaxID=4170 RepID=A0A5A7P3A6_STRAF|nr:squamosa promoter binding protein-like 15 [Striga asiatica]
MTENPKLEDMCSNNRSTTMEEKKDGKISVSDHLSDSFVVDLNRFAHLMEKDINSSNSRITLQRNLSRKGSVRNGELKISGNDRDAVTTSSTAGSTPEKPGPMAVGPAEQAHHQITINSGDPAAGGVAAESINSVGRRFSFRRTRPMTIISNPKQILVFFATLSSIGTILLIYFTLSMAKLNSDGNASI